MEIIGYQTTPQKVVWVCLYCSLLEGVHIRVCTMYVLSLIMHMQESWLDPIQEEGESEPEPAAQQPRSPPKSHIPVNCDLLMLPLVCEPSTFKYTSYTDAQKPYLQHMKATVCGDGLVGIYSLASHLFYGGRVAMHFSNPHGALHLPSNTKIMGEPLEDSFGIHLGLMTEEGKKKTAEERKSGHAADMGWSSCISVDDSLQAYLLVPDIRMKPNTILVKNCKSFMLALVRVLLVSHLHTG